MSPFCDVVEEKALAAASEYGGRAYGHYEALYDSETLDAVYICLPPFAHAQPELAAIERGLPIFVEKTRFDFPRTSPAPCKQLSAAKT